MLSLEPTAAAVKALDDSLPSVAYRYGQHDAMWGVEPTPSHYWTQRADQEQYLRGYYETRDAAEIEAMIDELLSPAQVDESQLAFILFDYDAEADDLAEDMLDREFHARGMW